MCMAGDADPWAVYHHEERRAAKPHTCGECRRIIDKGERYHHADGLMEGYWSTFKTCGQCWVAADWLGDVCDGWLYLEVEADLLNHVTGDERYLRTRPLSRLVRWMVADWRDRAGVLRPVEDVKAVVDEAKAAYHRQYAEAVA